MTSAAAPLTAADVEQRVRAVFDVWDSNDPARITAGYTGGIGFGYRTRDGRPPYESKDAYRAGLEHFQASLEHYSIKIDELHTAADGDIGMAWGFYTEELQQPGHAVEVVHARFSEVMRRDASGWRTLFYHRDAQAFDDEGRYVSPQP